MCPDTPYLGLYSIILSEIITRETLECMVTVTVHSVVTPSGELRGKGRSRRCGLFAGKTVWSTPERLRGAVLKTRRYTNLRLPLPYQRGLLTASNRQKTKKIFKFISQQKATASTLAKWNSQQTIKREKDRQQNGEEEFILWPTIRAMTAKGTASLLRSFSAVLNLNSMHTAD